MFHQYTDARDQGQSTLKNTRRVGFADSESAGIASIPSTNSPTSGYGMLGSIRCDREAVKAALKAKQIEIPKSQLGQHSRTLITERSHSRPCRDKVVALNDVCAMEEARC